MSKSLLIQGKSIYKSTYYRLLTACLVILLLPFLFFSYLDLSHYIFYGFSVMRWLVFGMVTLFIIVACPMIFSMIIYYIRNFNNETSYYYSKILTKNQNMGTLFIILGIVYLLFNSLFYVDCNSIVVTDFDIPDECKVAVINKCLLCGLVTVFGLIMVKWIVLAISHVYQKQVFEERMILNKYHTYVLTLLYEGCREEAIRLGITTGNVVEDDNASSSSSNSDSSNAMLAQMETFSGEDHLEHHHDDHEDTNYTFKDEVNLVNNTLRMLNKDSKNPLGVHPSGPDSSIRIYPLANFETFKKTAELYKNDFLSHSNSTNFLSSLDAKNRARFVYKVLHALKENKNEDYLVINDLQKIFRSKTSATEVYRIFDINHDGQMSKYELKKSFSNIYKEARNLNQSILSSVDALSALDVTLSGILFIILFMIYMVIFGIHLQNLLTLSLSLILGLSSITGNMSRDMFDSLCFLFITHPFDIGDHIKLTKDGEIYVVKQIYVLRTELTNSGGEEIYMANSSLLKQDIINLRRSSEQWEVVTLYIDSSTDETKLYKLRNNLTTFLKVNPSLFYTKFDMSTGSGIPGSEDINVHKLVITIQCKVLRDNMRRADRHHFLLNFLRIELEHHRIIYYPKGPNGPPIKYERNLKIYDEKHYRRRLSIASDPPEINIVKTAKAETANISNEQPPMKKTAYIEKNGKLGE